ncbi:MAG: coproporphyrinogen III oxidase [Firmicutes bacterium ADurb.Bin456]|nr:MAG: coproporphyrinogen III oxidase [Firmicutes bacterium ADurb.Bin456]
MIISSGIIASEHEVLVLDAIVEKLSFEECLQFIKKQNVDFVFFITGVSSWEEDFRFARSLKDACACTLIASGGILLHHYREVMEMYPFLDAVLLDFTSRNILTYLAAPHTLKPLPDLVLRQGDKLIEGGTERKKVFTIPVPRHDLFPLKKYRLPHSRYKQVTASVNNYGCPFKCAFCIAGTLGFKYRPWENVMEELQYIRTIGLKEVFFKDFTFEVPRQNSMEICRRMIAERIGLAWICSSRVDTVDEEMLSLMKAAGCHTIQFGVENNNEEILKDYEKNITPAQVRKTFALCRKYGIKILAHFILGLPGETKESIAATLQFAKELNPDYAAFNIAIPQVGTELRKKCLEKGYLKDQGMTMDSSRAYPLIETGLLTPGQVWNIRNQVIRDYYLRPSFLWKKVMGIRSPYDAVRLINEGASLILDTFTSKG